MNYEDTKTSMMRSYPNLFPYEEDVLNHLFFVNGNGYRWEEGELRGDYNTIEEVIIRARASSSEFYNSMIDWHKESEDKDDSHWQEKLKELNSPNYVEEERAREMVGGLQSTSRQDVRSESRQRQG